MSVFTALEGLILMAVTDDRMADVAAGTSSGRDVVKRLSGWVSLVAWTTYSSASTPARSS
ncbi:hypothetical protein [Actinomyces lilanjuaniae]|uniref:hypothetical protein n=1 Tax=Actinomyces lilanjuaniae TaxID=2321394 RepID=UPI003C12B8C8